mgnify:CR=1 FL=1
MKKSDKKKLKKYIDNCLLYTDKVLEKEREQIRDNIIEYFEVQQAEVRKEPIAGEMPVVIGTYPKCRKSVIREKKFEIDAEMQKALDQF